MVYKVKGLTVGLVFWLLSYLWVLKL